MKIDIPKTCLNAPLNERCQFCSSGQCEEYEIYSVNPYCNLYRKELADYTSNHKHDYFDVDYTKLKIEKALMVQGN